jgi:hypothetical protein
MQGVLRARHFLAGRCGCPCAGVVPAFVTSFCTMGYARDLFARLGRLSVSRDAEDLPRRPRNCSNKDARRGRIRRSRSALSVSGGAQCGASLWRGADGR